MIFCRDIKLENVLVFELDFSRVKLADFGGTTKEGLLVRKTNNTWTAFLSPEVKLNMFEKNKFIIKFPFQVLEVVKNERFHCRSSQDVWSFGVMIYLILTGALTLHNPPALDPCHLTYLTNFRIHAVGSCRLGA